MAKKSAIEKNAKRTNLARRIAGKRSRLRAIAIDRDAPPEERFAAQLKLAELPRNSEQHLREVPKACKEQYSDFQYRIPTEMPNIRVSTLLLGA